MQKESSLTVRLLQSAYRDYLNAVQQRYDELTRDFDGDKESPGAMAAHERAMEQIREEQEEGDANSKD